MEERLEIGSFLELHYFTGQRMGEREVFGMKVKTVGMETVEVIANNRHSQSVLVGTVHTQLVGAAGMRREQNAVIRSFLADKFIIGHRWFSLFVIYYLSRTVEIVGGERERDNPPLTPPRGRKRTTPALPV
jgi:hypothetical protein